MKEISEVQEKIRKRGEESFAILDLRSIGSAASHDRLTHPRGGPNAHMFIFYRGSISPIRFSLPLSFPFLSHLAASPRPRRRACSSELTDGPLLLRPTPHAARAPAPQSSRDRTAAPPPHADGPPGSSSSELANGTLLLRLALSGHLSAPGPRHLPTRAAAGSGGSGGGGARRVRRRRGAAGSGGSGGDGARRGAAPPPPRSSLFFCIQFFLMYFFVSSI